jgi:hypothetical protein
MERSGDNIKNTHQLARVMFDHEFDSTLEVNV